MKDSEGRPIGFRGIVRDVNDRWRAEEEIKRKNTLLEAINTVIRSSLICETHEEVAQTCLAVSEELTGSKFGFIGKLNPAGRFDTVALSDPGWDTCREYLSQMRWQ
jgi:hypothetical protein